MKVIHVLADGSEVTDLTDHVVGEDNPDFYQAVENIIEEANQ